MSLPLPEEPATVSRPCPCIAVCLACAAVLALVPAVRAEMPAWLPRYDVGVKIEVERHQVVVKERVCWTNPHQVPTSKIVFNAHAHFSVPDADVPFFAKMLEILRLAA